MFTGLILELGEVKTLTKTHNSYKLSLVAKKCLEELKIGDSIAVNGVCLTVVAIGGGDFTVDVMPETVQNTTIGNFKAGYKVNLEKALKLSDRLDGHIVSGHVDALGKIVSKTQDGIAWRIKIAATSDTLRYIVHKGSVAIDGISLTVSAVDEHSLEVSIIPHTLAATTLGYKNVGDTVHIETDVLAKYIEKLIFTNKTAKAKSSSLSLKTLAEHGFLEV